SRPHHVGEPPARYFEERVGEGEHAEHPADLNGGESEFLPNRGSCGRDAHAVDVRDDRQNESKSKQFETCPLPVFHRRSPSSHNPSLLTRGDTVATPLHKR